MFKAPLLGQSLVGHGEVERNSAVAQALWTTQRGSARLVGRQFKRA